MNYSALEGSLLNFVKVSGKTLAQRSLGFNNWVDARRAFEVWPYSRVLLEPALHVTTIANEYGQQGKIGTNFASQDYLGLAYRQELKDAAHAAIDQFGVHSAGSPALCGRTQYLLELESAIAEQLGYESCLIYPTGWAAGFGVVTGLVREADVVLIDALCHNCLQEGAKQASNNLRKFNHNDVNHLEQLLQKERASNADGAIFIVTESLFSMDSDSPDLNAMVLLAQQYEAIIILDVAHDFGAMGEHGHGLIDGLITADWRDYIVMMGSFSKTFAANGGFVVASNSTRQYLKFHSSTLLFSNSISPIQTCVIKRAMEIVFSSQGQQLRHKLAENIKRLRLEMNLNNLRLAGLDSPIVPVYVDATTGDEATARLTSKFILKNGLHANLVEFPTVPRGKARFRFQVMATHQTNEVVAAAKIMFESRAEAIKELESIKANKK